MNNTKRIEFDVIGSSDKVLMKLEKVTGGTGTETIFCGSGTPARIKWTGGRYDNVRPSTLSFELIVEDKAQEEELQELLEGGWYVRIDTPYRWYGKLMPRFFSEPYAQYPYTVKLTAVDQLKMTNMVRPVLEDFNNPMDRSKPPYTLMDIIVKAIYNRYAYPGGYNIPYVNRIYVSSQIYAGTTPNNTILSETYADITNWMDKDHFTDYWTIVNDILKPLQLQLFQFQGYWWVMSFDAHWDGSVPTTEFARYDITSGFDWAYVREESFTHKVIEGCATHTKQLFNNAIRSYEAPAKRVVVKQAANENKNAQYGFIANGGYAYSGNGTELDWWWTAGGYDLREWGFNGIHKRFVQYNEDIGIFGIAGNTSPSTADSREVVSHLPSGDIEGAYLKFYVDLITTDANLDIKPLDYCKVKILVMLDGDGWGTYYLNENGDWTASLEVIDKVMSGNSYDKVDITSNGLPWINHTFPTNARLTVRVQVPTTSNNSEVVFFGKMTTKMGSAYFDGHEDSRDYEQGYDINPVDGELPDLEHELRFAFSQGFTHVVNDWIYNRNVLMDSSGNEVKMLHLIYDGVHYTSSAAEHLSRTVINDNRKYTKRLTGTWDITSQGTPLTIFKDVDGNYYKMQEWEIDLRTGWWSVNWIEFKALRNVAGLPVIGDFSPFDFNDDFFKEL